MNLLPEAALRGIRLFNEGEYFEAHEALEAAWRAEPGEIRGLYQGLLQAAVFYFHLQRGNLAGARKLYERCLRRLTPLAPVSAGIQVQTLRETIQITWKSVLETGQAPQNLAVKINLAAPQFVRDRCGSPMRERQ